MTAKEEKEVEGKKKRMTRSERRKRKINKNETKVEGAKEEMVPGVEKKISKNAKRKSKRKAAALARAKELAEKV